MPDGAVELTADASLLRHFRAEYGPPDAVTPVRVAISIGGRLPDHAIRDLDGRHKTVSWSVSLDSPTDPLRAWLTLRGRPRWFGVSLVQGFIVEPLISLASAGLGNVLLPAAAVAEKKGALLIIGRSRSGKTTLCARALALGRNVLGDDQVLIDADGMIRPFPRRMRVYDDLLETSPEAVRALPPDARLRLHLRRSVRLLTGGFVAPSMALPRRAFGGAEESAMLPVHRIVVINRSSRARELEVEPLAHGAAHSEAVEIIAEQRRHLSRVHRRDWLELVRSVAKQEDAILDGALPLAPAFRVTVPQGWGAPRAVQAVAGALDIT